MTNMEENKKFLEDALNKSDDTKYTDEDLWVDIRDTGRSFLSKLRTCATPEERAELKEQINLYNNFAKDLINGCRDRYKRDYLTEDIKVRKAHEMNEAAKMCMNNGQAGSLILAGLAQMFDTPVVSSINTQTNPVLTTEKTEDASIKVDVNLKDI